MPHLYICRSYCSQRDRSRRQAYQPAVPRVGLVDSVGVIVAELVHDLGDAVVVAFGEGIADDGLESVTLFD